jgi:hypothetical protein
VGGFVFTAPRTRCIVSAVITSLSRVFTYLPLVIAVWVLSGCTLPGEQSVRAINEMDWPMLVVVDGRSMVLQSEQDSLFSVEWDYPVGVYTLFESEKHTAKAYARPANFEDSTTWTHQTEIEMKPDTEGDRNSYEWVIRPEDAVYE